MSAIANYFKLDELNTSIRTEFIAGLTTFTSMAYILFVNPSVLGAAGMDKGAVFTATAVASAVATLFMGIVALYPIAIAPGLGVNAFFCLFCRYWHEGPMGNSHGRCFRCCDYLFGSNIF